MSALVPSQTFSFFEDGYLILPRVVQPSELDGLKREMSEQIDKVAKDLQATGKLTRLHEQEGFETRLARIYEDSRENGEAVMKVLEGMAGGGYTGRAMYNLITHPRLLDVIESLVGAEIVAASTYRIRPKIPGKSRGVVPWHQDSGYFAAQCDRHLIITAWIPLIDATEHNGCMKILPRAHRGGVLTHHTGGNADFLVISDLDLPAGAPEPITAECPIGGVVLMTNLTPHSSTPNHSHQVRWSVDLRYQSADVPNNVALWPAVDEKPTAELLMACYPPEADFIVRSRRDPSCVTDYETFVRRRNHYDAVKQKAYPQRNWTPVTSPAK